jgi:hypothetical protein
MTWRGTSPLEEPKVAGMVVDDDEAPTRTATEPPGPLVGIYMNEGKP